MQTLASFGPTATPKVWYELPISVWVCDAPRREQSHPVKTNYMGDDHRVLGRPEFGLHPLEDAVKRIAAQAKRIQEAKAAAAEYTALHTAREYDRLYAKVGYYAVEMICESAGITRAEFSERLALASGVMEGAA